ncbi:MAG: T9SS type A sorting domain-containing protein [Flavobacterium sp.]|nr:T9SS type A sorting domain-containing protein [Flavobacterium sp.]
MLAVTFGTDFLNDADFDSTWSGYMNFVVRDEGNQTLGYSPYPGSPLAGETVVMNTFCFGTGSGCVVNGVSYVPLAPFNLGRTVTHELGHFFNLDHTFASNSCTGSTNCNTEGDRVCDTPRVTNESYDCPSAGSVNACGTLKSLTMNYMDYVDDPCMYMFTQGQTTRMLAQLNVIASEFNQNTLSSDTFLANPTFTVYPNPNKGDFSIDFDQNSIDNLVIVYDVTGRKVYENNFQNAISTVIIKMNGTTKGIYSIVVSNEEGTSSRKMIIQ